MHKHVTRHTRPHPATRSPAALALALAAVMVLGVPAGGADPLDRATERLERSEQELESLDDAHSEARDALDDAAERLDLARADLAVVEQDLDDAEEALAAASRRERAAAARLMEANSGLDEQVEAWEASRSSLQDRVADAYKYGGTPSSRVLLEGVLGSRDMHDIAVTMHTAEVLIERDRAAVAANADHAVAAAEARAEIAELRTEALREAQRAADERERVADLLDRQERLIEDISAERDRQQDLLRRIEADQQAKEALVRELRVEIASLRGGPADAYYVDPADLPIDGPMPAWAGALPSHGQAWAPVINAVATSHGLDGRLLAALVWTESNFRPGAVSHAGAIGLAQLMPGTARGLGVDPWDPVQNLSGGARYLRAQLERFGRVDLALAAYNAGPGRVERAGGIPNIVETQHYVVRVLERYQHLAAAG